MRRAELKRALISLLESCDTSTQFLQGVVAALENLHSDDDDTNTAAGFAALDEAIDRFAEAEADVLDDDEEE